MLTAPSSCPLSPHYSRSSCPGFSYLNGSCVPSIGSFTNVALESRWSGPTGPWLSLTNSASPITSLTGVDDKSANPDTGNQGLFKGALELVAETYTEYVDNGIGIHIEIFAYFVPVDAGQLLYFTIAKKLSDKVGMNIQLLIDLVDGAY
jgi:hypothetical protein